MSSPKERNAPRRRPDEAPEEWLWGWHAVAAALGNPRRPEARRVLATPDQARRLEQTFGRIAGLETCDAQTVARALPQGAAHQGVAIKAAPPEPAELADFQARPGALLVMLDQVTDPQNVGAILRSAAAFGAAGVILQDRNAPRFTGALAKAAAGALDALPVARVTNLSRALEQLSDAGWRTVGMAGEAGESLADVMDAARDQPTVLVMGSEGEGLRRLVAEHCDVLAKIPMPGGFESLNVSAAAAVALYEATRGR